MLHTAKQMERYAESNRPFYFLFFCNFNFTRAKEILLKGDHVSWDISMFHLRKYVIDFDTILHQKCIPKQTDPVGIHEG